MSLSPTTKLEAVNTMLTSIGEQPIQNMNDLAGLSDASIAEQILDNVSRAIQSRGWIFNTDLDVQMSVSIILGYQVVPQGCEFLQAELRFGQEASPVISSTNIIQVIQRPQIFLTQVEFDIDNMPSM